MKTPDGRIVFIGQHAYGALSGLRAVSGSYEVDSANLTTLRVMSETSVGAAQTGFDTDSIFRLYGYVP